MVGGIIVEERLRRLLSERVEDYLTMVERMLGAVEPPLGWEAMQERLRPLAAAWRALLATHHLGVTGRCRRCGGIRRRSPCSVWRTAHAHFIAAVPPHPGEQAGHDGR